MSERRALEKIAEEFNSMCIDDLSIAEKHVLKLAIDALNWSYTLNDSREIHLVYKY